MTNSRKVSFNEMATIVFIDISPMQEQSGLFWYSADDVMRFRRLRAMLTEYLDFYTDEELYDSFGLQSWSRMEQKQKRVRRIHLCMHLMTQQGHTWIPEIKRGVNLAAKLYVMESQVCRRDALQRAQRMELQLRH